MQLRCLSGEEAINQPMTRLLEVVVRQAPAPFFLEKLQRRISR